MNEDEEAVEEQVDAIENYDRPPPKCAIQVQKAVFIAGSTTSEDGRKVSYLGFAILDERSALDAECIVCTGSGRTRLRSSKRTIMPG